MAEIIENEVKYKLENLGIRDIFTRANNLLDSIADHLFKITAGAIKVLENFRPLHRFSFP